MMGAWLISLAVSWTLTTRGGLHLTSLILHVGVGTLNIRYSVGDKRIVFCF